MGIGDGSSSQGVSGGKREFSCKFFLAEPMDQIGPKFQELQCGRWR